MDMGQFNEIFDEGYKLGLQMASISCLSFIEGYINQEMADKLKEQLIERKYYVEILDESDQV